MNEMCPCINTNARPNNNQVITYYQRVRYLLQILQYPVNNTYNKSSIREKCNYKVGQSQLWIPILWKIRDDFAEKF